MHDTSTQTPGADVEDGLDHAIDIAAPPERVWALVSEPGWWINTGAIHPHDLERDRGITVVDDAELGRFAIELVSRREPDFVAYRWLPGAGNAPGTPSTLVEFSLSAQGEQVRLAVTESGFSRGEISDRDRAELVAQRRDGWQVELAAAKTHLESAS